jgi:hypothetical protein
MVPPRVLMFLLVADTPRGAVYVPELCPFTFIHTFSVQYTSGSPLRATGFNPTLVQG